MEDRITLALFIAIILIVPGILSIIKSEMMYKSSATYVYPKNPSRAAIKRFVISGYVSACLGIVLVIIALLGGFKGT